MINKEQPTNLGDAIDGGDAVDISYAPAPTTYKGPIPAYVDKVLLNGRLRPIQHHLLLLYGI